MKRFLPVILLFIPASILAQQPPPMNMEEMEAMMKQMEKVTACLEGINKQDLHQMERETDKFMQEMQSLCSSGKRDVAQSKAIAFGQTMSDNKVIKEIHRCNNLVDASMKQFMPPDMFVEPIGDYSNSHVCDEF